LVNYLTLKRLTPDGLPAVAELDVLCLGGLWTLAGYQRELESPNSDLLVLVERDRPDSIIGIGCVWSILEEAHITVLGIHPDYRQQGWGQALLYGLLWVAWRRGLERATLEVRASNQAAQSLYQKFGFAVAGRRRHYYQDDREDALIFWLNDLHKSEFLQNLAHWQTQISDRLLASNCQIVIDWDSLSHPRTQCSSVKSDPP
jgi:ribosomal-protein-alanine N-acetyltransferase